MGLLGRREFLAALPAAQIFRAPVNTRPAPAPPRKAPVTTEAKRYADPLTEREVWRLTPLTNPHYLPHSYQHFASEKNSFLLLAGERDGAPQVFRLELPSARLAQVSRGPGVAPFSICLAPDERSFFFLQDRSLKQVGLRTLKEREIWRVEEGWEPGGDLGVSIDGRCAALVEQGPGTWRIRVVETFKGKNWIVAEEKVRLSRPQLRPKRDQVLYCQDGPSRLRLVNLDGKQKQALRPPQGDEQLGPEYWTGDGKLIGYVHYPDQSLRRATIRALNPDTREETVLGRCTQFWDAMGNADNSAIVGESRSKAGPNIYVLFPLTGREITVCEHSSSRRNEKAEPRPSFSPDSQWIYFTSDREGVPAVYRAGVSDWVEKT